MKHRGICRAWALAAALVAGAATAQVAALAAGADTKPESKVEPLRICADPDNLPFTKADGPEKGLYIELAELVAAHLKQPIDYNWYYTTNQRRMLRNTVGRNECDAVFALPSDYRARALMRSKPFLSVGYAVVAAPGYSFASLDDLKRKHIGVQFSTTPHILLSTLEGFRSSTYLASDQIFAALAKGEIEIALMWGPVAGYENRKLHGSRWQITPVSGHDLAGQVSVGVRREREDLLKAIDGALGTLAPQIQGLADKYAFPRSRPVELAQRDDRQRDSTSVPAGLIAQVQDRSAPKAEKKPAPKAAAKPATAAATAIATTAPAGIAADHPGRVRFNDQCSHCHGQDGFSPVRERDLRRLKSRYDAKWEETALKTIRDGRIEAGMPSWKDILKEGEVKELMAFLGGIQK